MHPQLQNERGLIRLFFSTLRQRTIRINNRLLHHHFNNLISGRPRPNHGTMRARSTRDIFFGTTRQLASNPRRTPNRVFLPTGKIARTLFNTMNRNISNRIPPNRILPSIKCGNRTIKITTVKVATLNTRNNSLVRPTIPLRNRNTVLRSNKSTPLFSRRLRRLLQTNNNTRIPIIKYRTRRAIPSATTRNVNHGAYPIRHIRRNKNTKLCNSIRSSTSSCYEIVLLPS